MKPHPDLMRQTTIRDRLKTPTLARVVVVAQQRNRL